MNTADGLSADVVRALVEAGESWAEIATRFDTSRQNVQQFAKRHGIEPLKTPRREVAEHFPWKVPSDQQAAMPYQRLRDHGEYIASGGVGMSERKLKGLRSWYEMLRKYNYVLEFDPHQPPIYGVSKYGGFVYRERQESDGNLLIRLNSHTRLTSRGKLIWVFPPRDP
ncbi:XRE family transcriptional regulator [Nocardia brasiliensis]|uniref:XRE family transcriptional regulator n=2 Tax=Nocardia brasiliensis TaxID=37326 RepID=A0A6G9Y3Z8_NOCBR|nr:XRE family transcriptional regulator [Nocardia brasiliensis]